MGVPSERLEHRNEIRLVGRIAAEPKARVLPSGDELVSVRLVVERPPDATARSRRASVDTMTCVGWTPMARYWLQMVEKDDVVEVTGSLRRRFWRSAEGPRNRYEVEVTRATLLTGEANQDSPGTDADVVPLKGGGGVSGV
ncbi:single-stranded DNA-binding protein [Phytoactinopolyspora mesophila]|uniref:Single-stranded DNA-binding protein n=1 Tax=Phytoactinopolyspora mesophila TaxID=2650750 RepID=A0A7K3MCK5_9ACTN|nr:single-stranded DNA-binding protein [Phytoactinopolyspora mesophila]NDL61059.1 single-stranded DNA-binding protein [Phytoactinopolyspora mesophila]